MDLIHRGFNALFSAQKPFGFYTILALYLIGASLLGLHGSSIKMFAFYFSGSQRPLVGTPKPIRGDEWNAHTPVILHELFRKDFLSVDDGPVGPGHALLLWNAPVKHPVMFFRPQYWPFFILAPERAFSVYWQLKICLLIGGVFSIIYLGARDAIISSIMALFFFFSAEMQWAFSWPSMLPEMIGSACLAMTLLCLALVNRSRVVMLATAVAAGLFAVDFALCAYPPHQVPIAWAIFPILPWWIISRWSELVDPRLLWWRLIAVGLSAGVVVCGLTIFYVSAHDAIIAGMNTVYPGQRRVEGGGTSILLYFSHFLDFWKTEANIPEEWANIVEATGYFWFAPFTALFANRLEASPTRSLYFTLLGTFAALALWIFLPIPAWVGHPFALDLASTGRAVAAMGLLNALILGTFLSSYAPLRSFDWVTLIYSLFIFVVFLVILIYINNVYALRIRMLDVAVSALFVAATIGFIGARKLLALSILLVAPLALAWGLVNPVDRGLDVITHSELSKFLDENPDLRSKKWLVFSDDVVGPNYFSAHGLDVFDSLRVIPELSAFKKIDPEGQYLPIYNSSGYLIVRGQDAAHDVSFKSSREGVIELSINPSDPKLRDVGISVFAFQTKPPDDWTTGLKRVSQLGRDGYWIYESQ